jgi:exodeoxyribonuclease VII large subunit
LLLRVETRVEGLARRVEQRSPGLELERRASRLDLAAARLPAAVRQRLERLSSRLDSSARALEAVSPVAVLARGYSITFVEGSTTPLTDANAATNGDTLVTRLSHGELRSRVETTS